MIEIARGKGEPAKITFGHRHIRAVLVRTFDERSLQSAGFRGVEVIFVRGDQHDLGRRDIEYLGHAKIRLGIGLVMTEDLGGENQVLGETGVFSHIRQQPEIAIR